MNAREDIARRLMQRHAVTRLLRLGVMLTTAEDRGDHVAAADLRTALDDARIGIRLAAGVQP